MMMNFEVTRKELFSRVSQEEIMKNYFPGDIVFHKKIKNPFRNDTSPSCYFTYSSNGVLLFYDHATEKVFFTCIDIACLVTGETIPSVYTRIFTDLQAGKRYETKELINTASREKVKTSIKVKLTSFTEKDLEYWRQYFISPQILSYFNVRKCEKVWINDSFWHKSSEKDPAYRYRQKDDIKIYRPFAKKEDKFRNNYSNGLLDGWEQLPVRGDMCFIIKAYKDTMSVFNFGFTSVAVKSENTLVSKNAIALLKKRFYKVIPYMDNDTTGKVSLQKYESEYGLKGICHPDDAPKDPSDWIKENHNNWNNWIENEIKKII